jgi:hypothetical protein
MASAAATVTVLLADALRTLTTPWIDGAQIER